VLLNDPTYVEAARVLATRILTEGTGDDASRLAWAWRQVLQRAPQPAETARLQTLLDQHRTAYRGETEAATALLKVGASPVPGTLDPAELAAWTNIARVLLNLHESITRS
jgi:hypothetical protein